MLYPIGHQLEKISRNLNYPLLTRGAPFQVGKGEAETQYRKGFWLFFVCYRIFKIENNNKEVFFL